MNFIKVTAWKCNSKGERDNLAPQEHFKLNVNHILAIKERIVWLKENVIQLNGNFYCDIQITNEITLDNL